MFTKANASNKDQFLEEAKAARIERANEKKKEQSVIVIQSYTRGFAVRKNLKKEIRTEFDAIFKENFKPDKLLSAFEMYNVIQRLLFVITDDDEDKQRFEKICKYVIMSMESDALKKSYISVAFSKEHAVAWIHHLKSLLWQSCVYLKALKPEAPQDLKPLMLYFHMLVLFTSTGTWKVLNNKTGESLKPAMNQLCANVMGHLVTKGLYSVLQTVLLKGLVRAKPCLKHAALLAITNLAVRPVVAAQGSAQLPNLMNLLLLHVLSVPALAHHFSVSAPECLAILASHNIFKHSLDLLMTEQNTRILFNALEGNYALCLIANLIHLGYTDLVELQTNLLDFINVITRLLQSCQKYVVNKKSNLTHWHPVLGWFAQKIDHGLHESLVHVKKQLQLLWNGAMVKTMFSHLVESLASPSSPENNGQNYALVQPSPSRTSSMS